MTKFVFAISQGIERLFSQKRLVTLPSSFRELRDSLSLQTYNANSINKSLIWLSNNELKFLSNQNKLEIILNFSQIRALLPNRLRSLDIHFKRKKKKHIAL
jgi:hypothetical protein